MPLFTVPSRDPQGPAPQLHWLATLKQQDWFRGMRADGQANLLAVAEAMATRIDFDTLETRKCTLEVLMEVTGLGERTVYRHRQELKVRGFVAHIERGTTPQYRPMALAGQVSEEDQENRAAVYKLRIPVTPEEAVQIAANELMAEVTAQLQLAAAGQHNATHGPTHIAVELLEEVAGARPPVAIIDEPAETLVDEPVDPVDQAVVAAAAAGSESISGSPYYSPSLEILSWVGGLSRARASDVHKLGTSTQVPAPKAIRGALRARSDQGRWLDWAVEVPTTHAQMRAAAVWLRRHDPVMAQLSVRAVRRMVRPFWAASWINLDVVHALRHLPSTFGQVPGVPLYTTERLADPRWFVKRRLQAWIGPDRRVLPGRCSSAAAVQVRRGRIGMRMAQAGGGVLTVEQLVQHGHQAAAQLQLEHQLDAQANEHVAEHRAAEQAAAAAEVAGWRPVQPVSPRPPQPKPSSRPSRQERQTAAVQASVERGEQLRTRRAAEEEARARYAEQLQARRTTTAPDPAVPDAVDQVRDERSPAQRHRDAVLKARADRKASGLPRRPARRRRRA